MPTLNATITAENTFTTWQNLQGLFQVHIDGLTDSVITFQGSPDDGDTIYDLETFDAPTVDNTIHVGTVGRSEWVYRIGCKTGDYNSDTVLVSISY